MAHNENNPLPIMWPIYQIAPPPPANWTTCEVEGDQRMTIKVNKDTHRIKYDRETEHGVVITIEPKE